MEKARLIRTKGVVNRGFDMTNMSPRYYAMLALERMALSRRTGQCWYGTERILSIIRSLYN